ncbi:dsDNA-binding protein PDCD5 [Histoplasma capsulatum var. duboisii H88]|uniref:DsDNA-binding protein PDCD5 n=1 Tax=Ajellomyces capsulatus (strain H88) TaxID=544711 RepID=F0URX0_AJEC8|nr:dsDNA-binding protein PDCD5 [Histoplasma capsulatum var. duboisii H88]
MADAELEELALHNCRHKQDEVQGQVTARTSIRGADASQAILNQILLPEAADRLGRIRLVKEERATDIENRLIMLARTGQLQAKVTEEQLKELLNAVAENKKEEKIVINRRKDGWDNDDDDDDLSDLRRGF